MNLKLHTINTGFFKLDGGAMFGVVPKVIWNKTNPADENNLCTWAMRCLLIELQDKLILIDNGIGSKQDSKFLSHFHLHGEETLKGSIQKAGFSLEDITDNVLTHLHFDHCGGGVVFKENSTTEYTTLFFKANYWVHSDHWKWATIPNPREKASFLKENILPMQSSGQLKFLDQSNFSLPGMDFMYVDGHTEKQALPKIEYKGKKIIFVADLIPSVAHIPIPYVMAYDTKPLQTMKEKELFLTEAAEKNYILFFEHDPVNECCTVVKTEKGVRVKEIFNLEDI